MIDRCLHRGSENKEGREDITGRMVIVSSAYQVRVLYEA
jgi:hypothetical protein